MLAARLLRPRSVDRHHLRLHCYRHRLHPHHPCPCLRRLLLHHLPRLHRNHQRHHRLRHLLSRTLLSRTLAGTRRQSRRRGCAACAAPRCCAGRAGRCMELKHDGALTPALTLTVILTLARCRAFWRPSRNRAGAPSASANPNPNPKPKPNPNPNPNPNPYPSPNPSPNRNPTPNQARHRPWRAGGASRGSILPS